MNLPFIASPSSKSNLLSLQITERAHFFSEASVFLKVGAESTLVKFHLMAEMTYKSASAFGHRINPGVFVHVDLSPDTCNCANYAATVCFLMYVIKSAGSTSASVSLWTFLHSFTNRNVLWDQSTGPLAPSGIAV